MGLREPAWRTTTQELAAAQSEERGRGERAATYLWSPYGGRFNRVAIAGILGPAEAVGRTEAQSFWKARLTDPFGTVGVTAGGFQPRAMVQLRAAAPDRPALVVGKVHLFRASDGTGIVSLRAEAVRSVAEAEERAALAEALRQTLDRLDLLERLEHEPGATEASLREAGYPRAWITAAREARRRFPDADRAGFRAGLRAGIARVAGRLGPATAGAPWPPGVTRTVDAAPPVGEPGGPADRAEEAALLALVDEGAEGSPDGYADVREVLRRLLDRGIGAERAEALLGRLEEGGALQEPIVGKLRRA